MKKIPEKEFLTNHVRYIPDKYKTGKPRKKIIKLAKMFNSPVPLPIKMTDSYYWGLDFMCPTDEQADIALALGKRKPKRLGEIARLTGKSEEELLPLLEEMCWRGLIEYNYENEDGEKQWQTPLWIPGPCEFSNMNLDVRREHSEAGRFFDLTSYMPATMLAHMIPPGGAGNSMHVIPVEKALNDCMGTLDVEHISHWLEKYDGKIAAGTCSCRSAHETYDENCGDDIGHWCIALGDMAEYEVETNKGGKYVTKEEAIDILHKAEKLGYVHQITSIDGPDKIIAICNCNVNICYGLRMSQLFNTPNMSRSAFVSHVIPEKCMACGQCVEHCPAGAVRLGQKLCTVKGPVQYPKQDLPDDHCWGEEKWDWDYVAHNRIPSHKTGTAPCKSACPAHIGVQGYLKLAALGRYNEALELIKKDNPFPAVCGRICNKRCEDACTRGSVDQAVAIDDVKRFLAERDLDPVTRSIPEKIAPVSLTNSFDEKIAIIGGGPAGLTCAYYLAIKGYTPTVFEMHEKPGGMMVYGIPSFKLEKDVVDAEIEVLRDLGVEIRCGVTVGEDVTIQQLRDHGYKAFYIAIGCQASNRPGVPNDDADGIQSALDHLYHVGAGNYKLSGRTVVVGGGNVAIDAARTAMRVGASDVQMFCLESREEMPAADDEIEEAAEENIGLHCGWGPKEFLKDENGHVTGIIFKKCTQVKNAEGRFDPKYDEEDTLTIEADNVITSIGQRVDWKGMLDGEPIEYVHGNYPKADPHNYQTSVPDIFVGGDVYTGPKFVIDAIAAGRIAAESLHRSVRPHTDMNLGRDWREFNMLDKETALIPLGYDKTPRQIPGRDRAVSKADPFRDDRLSLTEEQVKKETARCLSCGVSVVDENRCIGCGLCTTFCKFDAIHLSRDLPEQSVMVRNEDAFKAILPYAAKRAVKIVKREVKDRLS